MMPLSLIPSFLVPLWIIIHFASLLQLRQAGALLVVQTQSSGLSATQARSATTNMARAAPTS